MKNIQVLYEDKDVLAVNKPSGLVVNRSATAKGDTLQDFLETKIDLSKYDTESDFVRRSGLVHRLDKETSGVVLAAKTPDSFIFMQSQFKERLVKKIYKAVLIGELRNSRIEINAPLGRSPRSRLKQAVVSGGRISMTRIELKKVFKKEGDKFSLTDVYPESGRTHQIRVHAAAINHPVAGDTLYSGRKRAEKYRKLFGRLMLHAYSISFIPSSGTEEITVTAKIPPEFDQQ